MPPTTTLHCGRVHSIPSGLSSLSITSLCYTSVSSRYRSHHQTLLFYIFFCCCLPHLLYLFDKENESAVDKVFIHDVFSCRFQTSPQKKSDVFFPFIFFLSQKYCLVLKLLKSVNFFNVPYSCDDRRDGNV